MDQTVKENLKQIFGFSQFRGNQELIVDNILSGRNTFVIMPTGAGKSLCYQLPAVIKEGTAIVISPLIALMKNQVDQMNAFNIEAHFLNSTLNKSETTKVKKGVLSGKTKLLYVAPESLTKDENVKFLKEANISFVAIDEAHCISEWGHDFRPEYRRIKSIIAQIGENLPIIALTATATPKVQQDIQRNLQMEEADLFKSSFNRTNLYYEVRPKIKNETKKQIIKYIKSQKGKSGIIYCLSRKKVEEIAELLKVNGINAAPYHAGLDGHVRVKNQDDFLNEEVDVIVATIAFGMGIDKPDVRYVIHYDVPKSLEGYYQETGRAGRDGLEGHCLMFYKYDDIVKLEKFNKDKPVTERENARVLLQEMAAYAESSVCRRKVLLHYFGEFLAEDCGQCDNCKKPKEKFEGMDYLLLAIEAVKVTNQRFNLEHLVKVLRGEGNEYMASYEHDQLPVFGKGKDLDEKTWRTIIRQGMIMGFLEKDIENYGVVKMAALGESFLTDPFSVQISKDHNFEEIAENETLENLSNSAKAYDERLFELLKAERKKMAKSKGLPPYIIFQDPSLEEMATVYPTTREELAQINGVGMGKVVKFGLPFIKLIENYVEENDILTASDVVVKTSGTRSKVKISIIQQVDRKVNLDEIAENLNISMSELLHEIEQIIYSGTKLNINYYIENIMDEDREDILQDYFMTSHTDNIKAALLELESQDFAEEEIRVYRVKFISENAN
ncbi:ATP-dependent DNA helicase RecQ [Rhodonellum psychrophilum GCM71 = DSM 17998]|uniref:DNA helicase RecQ n=2 Tax=Rhodonellum TaxID=336827 RepID=U5C1Y4_9BACT|nr:MULTISPECIES: DNA helicase RecQ [Rhodonellum]ERM82192.1 ATP-dependent DNA helicase RecQ [Rhodonellum psychrophilum GCM71 = DSM 17998]MDO9551509.1 DNA helicase RecQ [Rhodonellum sp.]SDZ41122.1 ATP-dependent DNA helicase RecQ [Rhodonellum ikkaensis]